MQEIVIEKKKKSKIVLRKTSRWLPADGVSVHILPGSIRLKLMVLILSGKDVVRIPKTTIETKNLSTNESNFISSIQNIKCYDVTQFFSFFFSSSRFIREIFTYVFLYAYINKLILIFY